MIDKYILDANGDPVECDDLIKWGKALENETARCVDRTEKNGVLVSTVFLGIDHSFGNGEPLLFETMIFGGPHDQFTDRYTTRADAQAGHKRACAMCWGDDHD